MASDHQPHRTYGDYTVGCICPMGVELAPVEAMLDETHKALSLGHDRNAYVLGRIGIHNITIAIMPEIGNNTAATVATQLLNDFPAIRFCLLVGIGGGVPGNVDIRLGDVVVSQPTETFGGVVQFDLGKRLEGGRFQRTGQLNKPPAVLNSNVRRLEAQHRQLGHRLSALLSKMIATHPEMKANYSLPATRDQLFDSNYTHQSGSTCDHCDQHYTIFRRSRPDSEPQIHYGTIGSANIVVKDALLRDELKKDVNILCIEMEAAALMDSFPCLVIRGICDYADSHKNKEWQPYAAAMAAAYMKELLTIIPGLETIQAPAQANRKSEIKINLDKIPYAKGAIFNSFESSHKVCHRNTRVELLQQIYAWARDLNGKRIFWLHGAAGIGKSTISWTFAQWLTQRGETENIQLGATFFFKRGEGNRGSSIRFFSTIIRQLVVEVPGLDEVIARVIEADPFIFDKTLGEQFRRLFLDPLRELSNQDSKISVLVIVDALDECESDLDIQTIIELWAQLSEIKTVEVRLFLTSRPDQPLRLKFKEMSTDIFCNIVLQDAVPKTTIEHDLFVYLRDTFDEIRRQYNVHYSYGNLLTEDWPGSEILRILVDRAVPLFIVAATICRFVVDPEFNPSDRLNEILEYGRAGSSEPMEMTYLPVLKHLVTQERSFKERQELCNDFRDIVGSIICLAEPLSAIDIAMLLNRSVQSVMRRLNPLHSVLHIPNRTEEPVRILHLSFAEFLLSSNHRPFGIDGTKTHFALLRHCLRLLSGQNGLRENICDLQHPGQLRANIHTKVIEARLPFPFRYACCYWVYHAQQSKFSIKDYDLVYYFLHKHFLHWLEALSIFGQISEAAGFVDVLRSLVTTTEASRLSAFLEDARRFVLANRYIANIAPLQLYVSAIIFAPQNSIVKNVCGRELGWVKLRPETSKTWNPILQRLTVDDTYPDQVSSVSFSPDGSLLASGTSKGIIRLWSVTRGVEVQRLDGHQATVSALAFSADTSFLASGSHDKTVRIWEIRTNRNLHQLKWHKGHVQAISFSPDGTLLASVSKFSVRLWQMKTGQEVHRMEGQKALRTTLYKFDVPHVILDFSFAVAFSLDSSLLASVSGNDEPIQVWNARTGEILRSLREHEGEVETLRFSDDGLILSSASSTGTVQWWDVQTGLQVQKVKLHMGRNEISLGGGVLSTDGNILALARAKIELWNLETGCRIWSYSEPSQSLSFSSDGSLIASASTTRDITLFDIGMSYEWQKQDPDQHAAAVVTFCPNGLFVACVLWSGSAVLLNARTGAEVQNFKELGLVLTTLQFSPDGSLLALASNIGRIILWKVNDGQQLWTIKEDTQNVNDVSFSPDGAFLASALEDGTVRLLDVQTGQTLQRFEQHAYKVRFSADGRFLFLAPYYGSYLLLEVATGARMRNRNELDVGLEQLSISSDGSLLATWDRSDRQVCLWDVGTGKKVQILDNVTADTTLRFSNDNKVLFTDHGPFAVGEQSQRTASLEALRSDPVTVADNWIRFHGHDVLWLPHDYRGPADICGNQIVVGTASQGVIFLRLDASPDFRLFRGDPLFGTGSFVHEPNKRLGPYLKSAGTTGGSVALLTDRSSNKRKPQQCLNMLEDPR